MTPNYQKIKSVDTNLEIEYFSFNLAIFITGSFKSLFKNGLEAMIQTLIKKKVLSMPLQKKMAGVKLMVMTGLFCEGVQEVLFCKNTKHL